MPNPAELLVLVIPPPIPSVYNIPFIRFSFINNNLRFSDFKDNIWFSFFSISAVNLFPSSIGFMILLFNLNFSSLF